MCDEACLQFVASSVTSSDVRNRDVLEVGSRNVNGSAREYVEQLEPARYVGVDIERGPGVDVLCSVEELVPAFGSDSFDLVICTEVLEHVLLWREAISGIKAVTRPNGLVVVTTRSRGFHLHGYPHDYWRFEPQDVREIFRDFTRVDVRPDPSALGVFMAARKPSDFQEAELADLELYSVLTQRRQANLGRARARALMHWRVTRRGMSRLSRRVAKAVLRAATRGRFQTKGDRDLRANDSNVG